MMDIQPELLKLAQILEGWLPLERSDRANLILVAGWVRNLAEKCAQHAGGRQGKQEGCPVGDSDVTPSGVVDDDLPVGVPPAPDPLWIIYKGEEPWLLTLRETKEDAWAAFWRHHGPLIFEARAVQVRLVEVGTQHAGGRQESTIAGATLSDAEKSVEAVAGIATHVESPAPLLLRIVEKLEGEAQLLFQRSHTGEPELHQRAEGLRRAVDVICIEVCNGTYLRPHHWPQHAGAPLCPECGTVDGRIVYGHEYDCDLIRQCGHEWHRGRV